MESNLLVKRNLKDIFSFITNRQDKVCRCTLNEKQKKTIKPSRDEWIKKMWYVYVYLCVYMCVCVCVYVCVCIYVYIPLNITLYIYNNSAVKRTK